MYSPFRRNWPLFVLAAICLAGALVAAPMSVAAQDAVPASLMPQAGNEIAAPNATTADDGGPWELGVHGSAGNLTTATAAERYGMWYWLNGWFVRRYSFGESTAWEQDFKRSALGGTENYYIDNVDLQFYVGHRASGRFTFYNANHDDSTLQSPGDCFDSWGDRDNEWLALTSCQVLSGSGLGNMRQCMDGQHLILGFVSNAAAHNNFRDTQAYHFGWRLRYNWTLKDAWFGACDVAQRGRQVRIIAEELSCFNDRPYSSSVCADVNDSDWWYWTHNCGTASASYVPEDLLQGQMPVYKVVPYSTADATEDINHLTGVFGLPSQGVVQVARTDEGPGVPPDPVANDPFYTSTDVSGTLQMDKGSGIYQYLDLTQTPSQQVEQAMAAQAASATAIDADAAITIANDFLNRNGLMPADAVVDEVVLDTVDQATDSVSAAGYDVVQQVAPLQQVLYTRVLTESRVTAAGVTQEITYTVVGPGAKQKVGLPTTGVVNAAGVLEAPVLSAQGGWRAVQQEVSAASGDAIMVNIEDEDTIKNLYLALGEMVALNPIPLDIESREVLSTTLAYYESTTGKSQGSLIPVRELNVRFTLNGGGTSDDFAYVPTSSTYLPPYAEILDAPTSTNVSSGMTMTLTAADATKTLKELGVGDDFDFVMGWNGAAGTYLYNWYVDSVAPENKLTDLNTSDGANKITFTVPTFDDAHERMLTIVLEVVDFDSENDSRSVDVAQIAAPALFMPAVSVPE